jgi:flagellar biosynthesis protein FlhF
MQIKKFEARDMTEALSMIKQEFGPDAVILSARSLKNHKGMFSYLKNTSVEVTAATDTYYPQTKRKKTITKTDISHEVKAKQLSNKDKDKRTNSPYQLQEKPNYLKYSLNALVRREPDISPDAKIFRRLQQLMLEQDVEKDIADQWIEELKGILAEKFHLNSEEIRQGLIQALKKMGVQAIPIKAKSKKRKVFAFIGPTGVGKTTTIAKLAVIHALKMKKSVAFITLDDRRIGAVEQLKVNAKIIGIPLEIASNKKELKRALKRLSNRDVILIDTPGMSQKNEYQVNELKSILDGLPHIRIHLLMSATSNNYTLKEILEKFKAISIDRLIFSKLDESTTFGNIVNQLCKSKIPVSYFSNGQEVPEHIEIASLERLVSLIIDDAEGGSFLQSPSSVIYEQEEVKNENSPDEHRIKFYVANKTSDVFHHLDCKSAKKIKGTSMIVFESVKNAIDEGYKPCKLCNPSGLVEHGAFCSFMGQKKRVSN